MKFKEDMEFVKPTIFVGVPRLYNRIVETVETKFQETSGFKKRLLDYAISSKLYYLRQKGKNHSRIYDKLIFNKVKESFGGQIRLMFTGSAPIKADTYEMMRICMSCPLYEGYGQTENTAAAFTQSISDYQPGFVGAIAVCFWICRAIWSSNSRICPR